MPRTQTSNANAKRLILRCIYASFLFRYFITSIRVVDDDDDDDDRQQN